MAIEGVIIDGFAVLRVGVGGVSSFRWGFGGCTPEKIFAFSDGCRRILEHIFSDKIVIIVGP
jgi:hypothetical protein